jgi:hypothetical protein
MCFSLYFEPEQFYCKVDELDSKENGGVAVATGWKVERLDVAEKKAYLTGGKEIQYEKCLIATGEILFCGIYFILTNVQALVQTVAKGGNLIHK